MKSLNRLTNRSNSLKLALIPGVILSGCSTQQQQPQSQNAFVVIEEVSQGNYKIKEEFPSEKTRIILQKLDGTQEVLTQEELDRLMKEESAKIDDGTSRLTQNDAQMHGGSMGLGEAILASAAGAIIGSWIGSKLFNNPAYQKQRQGAYKSPSTYQKSKNSFKKASHSRRKGFFNNNKRNGKRGFFGG